MGGLYLYWTRSRPGTNVYTFIPDGDSNRYKCEVFVPSGLEETPTHPCEETFVSGGGFNRYKCPHLYRGGGAIIPGTNEKSDQRQMSDSLVVK
jgi:hypothetical protein